MAHKIDETKGKSAFVSYQEPAWHGLGEVMQGAVSVKDALEKGGLDFDVVKLPNIHMLPNEETIISEDSFFTFRTDANKILGSRLGKDYTVLQNIEALDVVDAILQSGTASIATAGAIDEGRRVFITLKINDSITINGNDKIEQYVLIANSHDGSLAVTALPTNVRVVCHNTLSMALGQAKGKNGKGVKIRHTTNADARLKEAATILGLIRNNAEINSQNYQKMADTVISKAMFMQYVSDLFLDEKEVSAMRGGMKADDAISSRKQNIITDVLNFGNNGIGQAMTMKGNDMTMWSAYNAVTGYATGKKYASADARINSLLFGTSAELIDRATTLALAPLRTPDSKVVANLNFN